MKTKAIYLDNPDIHQITTRVISTGNDPKGQYITLEETIFYPQGGGQPADQGCINVDDIIYEIYDVRNVDQEIRHYSITPLKDVSNQTAYIAINTGRRDINTRYHTAGHLIASIAELIIPNIIAVKGHQFPNEAYIEFKGKIENIDEHHAALSHALAEYIQKDNIVETRDLTPLEAKPIIEKLPYSLPSNKGLRICDIHNLSPAPCGGTHVASLKSIGSIIIKQIKQKKGMIKIKYEVTQ